MHNTRHRENNTFNTALLINQKLKKMYRVIPYVTAYKVCLKINLNFIFENQIKRHLLASQS